MNIQKLTCQIRDYANHAWRRELLYQDRIKWNKMWASMDIMCLKEYVQKVNNTEL